MRFEVLYPSGARHEVELEGTLAVLGRDPSCDLVLNDSKCSRRHAVIEANAQGLVIRDSGSANGVYVNGKKVERTGLSEGDVIRLGEVSLTVLPDEVPGTLVMGPDEMKEIRGDAAAPGAPRPAPGPAPPPPPPAAVTPRPGPRPSGAPAPPPPAPAPPRKTSSPRLPERPTMPNPAEGARGFGTGGAEPIPRPLTLAVLSLFWLLFALIYGLAALAFALLPRITGAPPSIGGAVAAFFLSLLSLLLGAGLWFRAGWARYLQMGLAVIGVFTCIFTPAAAVILAYMIREETQIQFSGRRIMGQLPPAQAELMRRGGGEGAFGAGIVVTLLFALLSLLGTAIFAVPRYMGPGTPAGDRDDPVVLGQLTRLVNAQTQFREGTCRLGYGDLEALTNPASVIANYPAGGPPFVAADEVPQARSGYRFELTVQDPVPPADGCPTRSFRTFAYLATPETGDARHYRVGIDGVIRFAKARAATAEDPAVDAAGNR